MRSTALLGWSGRGAAPDPRDVRERIVRASDLVEPVCEPLPHAGAGWSMLLRGVQDPPWIAWVEPSGPDHASEAPPEIAGARWVLGVETLLGDPSRPESWLGRYRSMARVLEECGAGEAMLDPTTGRWFAGGTLRDLCAEDAEPSLDLLWSVRVARRAGSHLAWIATEGLQRCGRCELEMIEVPHELADAAAATIDALAALLVEGGAATGAPWQVGPRHQVALRTVQEAIEKLAPGAPGSLEDRRRASAGEEPSLADRAVVCDPRPRGAWTEAWVPPVELLREVAAGTVAVYRGRHERERMRRLAARSREDLTRLSERHGSATDPPPGRLRVAIDHAEGSCWMEVIGRAASGVLGQAIDVDGRALSGSPAEIVPWSAVVDWEWTLPEGRFGPSEVAALRRALEGPPR